MASTDDFWSPGNDVEGFSLAEGVEWELVASGKSLFLHQLWKELLSPTWRAKDEQCK